MDKQRDDLTEAERMEVVRRAFSHVDAAFVVEDEPLTGSRVVVIYVSDDHLSAALGEDAAIARQAAMESGFDVEVRLRDFSPRSTTDLDKPNKRRGPIGWLLSKTWRFWLVSVIVGPPVLYVASFGPVCRCVHPQDWTNLHRLIKFYTPLLRMVRREESTYLHWYGGETARSIYEARGLMDLFDPNPRTDQMRSIVE